MTVWDDGAWVVIPATWFTTGVPQIVGRILLFHPSSLRYAERPARRGGYASAPTDDPSTSRAPEFERWGGIERARGPSLDRRLIRRPTRRRGQWRDAAIWVLWAGVLTQLDATLVHAGAGLLIQYLVVATCSYVFYMIGRSAEFETQKAGRADTILAFWLGLLAAKIHHDTERRRRNSGRSKPG